MPQPPPPEPLREGDPALAPKPHTAAGDPGSVVGSESHVLASTPGSPDAIALLEQDISKQVTVGRTGVPPCIVGGTPGAAVLAIEMHGSRAAQTSPPTCSMSPVVSCAPDPRDSAVLL